MTPVSTSPVPAVASAAPPVRLTTAAPPGAATTVPGPFSNTIACRSAASDARRGDAIVTDGRAREPFVLARVRRQDRERVAGRVTSARGPTDRLRSRSARRRRPPSACRRRRRSRARRPASPCRARGRDRSRPRGSGRLPSATSAAAPSSSAPASVAGNAARDELVARHVRGRRRRPAPRTRPCRRRFAAPRVPASIGAPTMPFEPPTTRHPDDHLCASALGIGEHEIARASSVQSVAHVVDVDPDVDDVRRGPRATGPVRTAGRASARRSRSSRRRGPPRRATAPVAPSTPEGMSTASVGQPQGLELARDRRGRRRRARPGSPCRTWRRSRGRPASSAARSRASETVGRARTRRRRHPRRRSTLRRDPPVGAVVALAAHDDHPASVGAAEHAHARGGRPRRPARSTSTDSGVPAAIARRSASPISAGVSDGLHAVPPP